MTPRLSRMLLAATAALCAFAGPAPTARAEDPAALMQRIASLEGQVARLQAQTSQDWLTQRQAEEVKTLVRDVLADADTRATLLQDRVYAGYDKGFFLQSPSDDFHLNIGIWLAFRHLYNHQEDPLATDSDRDGFEISRVRLLFNGHVFDPSIKYTVLTGHNRDGGVLLLDTYLRKDFNENLYALVGQFKVPFLREYLISERMGQFVERSLISQEFSGGYTQGLLVGWKNDWLYLAGSFNDGLGALNSTWDVEGTDYALSARADLKLLGDWKNYSSFESWVDAEPLVVVGGGVHYQGGETGTLTDEATTFRWTIDGTVGLGGANLFAAVVGDHSETNSGAEADRYGAIVQGGYFLTPKWELVARYEWGDADVAGEDDLSVLTVGTNYFFEKHQLKLSFDAGYAFNGISPTWANSTAGWRTDPSGEDGQFLLRSQIALYF